MYGNRKRATALSTKTVPSEIEICSGSASMPGTAAAIALPPQIAVPVEISAEILSTDGWLNTGDLVLAGPDHSLRFEERDSGPSPYLHVRGGLEALVARCLAKDREERPADIEEVAAVLAEIARNHPWREIDARRWWKERAAALGIDVTPA